MKISVKLEVSESNGHHTFDLDDLGVTEQEWNEMSESEKNDAVEKAVFDLPEQPYWMVGSFDERQVALATNGLRIKNRFNVFYTLLCSRCGLLNDKL